MARALASSGAAAAAAGFVQPWLVVLGAALLSVWAVTLAVLLCGDGSKGRRRPSAQPRPRPLPACPAPSPGLTDEKGEAFDAAKKTPLVPFVYTMDLPSPSLRLQQTMEEEDNSTLIRYLIAEDKPNFELLDDNDEEMDTMVAAMDAENFFHRSIHERRFVPRDHADGEARIIRQYFAFNPVYTPEKFRESRELLVEFHTPFHERQAIRGRRQEIRVHGVRTDPPIHGTTPPPRMRGPSVHHMSHSHMRTCQGWRGGSTLTNALVGRHAACLGRFLAAAARHLKHVTKLSKKEKMSQTPASSLQVPAR
ncbi:uncharacterized protein C2845_PM03G00900 [Panicum miliaceum]|uniref:Uncharacterized protein n=1 Tax=Panicum miliaceum TaxID=4540 RepID=A0A3L6T3Y6_PANMI|nr:uncharacterized protein C2845_PM03G00900 [Panicum miliaceum]